MQTQWVFEKGVAKSESTHWRAKVKPTAPTQPTEISSLADNKAAWQVFSVEPQPSHQLEVAEAYVRQADLIAQYAQAPEDDFTFHLYWRNLPLSDSEQFGLELWLGVQTGLLDSNPKLNVSCGSSDGLPWTTYTHHDLTAAECGDPASEADVESSQLASSDRELGTGGPAAWVCRTPGSTGLWLIEPSDQRHTSQLSQASDSTASVQFFGHFMEKGVIRRGRMRFLVLPAEASLSDIRRAYERFSSSELPLTA